MRGSFAQAERRGGPVHSSRRFFPRPCQCPLRNTCTWTAPRETLALGQDGLDAGERRTLEELQLLAAKAERRHPNDHVAERPQYQSVATGCLADQNAIEAPLGCSQLDPSHQAQRPN